MQQYKSAWATITGKVFVNVIEMDDKLAELYPHYIDEAAQQEMSILDICTPDEEREAFEILAREALNNCHPTDDPMKVNEVEIDLSTYRV